MIMLDIVICCLLTIKQGFCVFSSFFFLQSLSPKELWHIVHQCYGTELGLTSEDDDYVSPTAEHMNGLLWVLMCKNMLIYMYSCLILLIYVCRHFKNLTEKKECEVVYFRNIFWFRLVS